MTAEAPCVLPRPGVAARPVPGAHWATKGNLIYRLITTTDHKLIGQMYLVTSFLSSCSVA